MNQEYTCEICGEKLIDSEDELLGLCPDCQEWAGELEELFEPLLDDA